MREILEKLINEEISIEECERLLKADTILEFDEVAKFDKSRSSRTGFPEAVFSPSKDYGDLLLIINNLWQNVRIRVFFVLIFLDNYVTRTAKNKSLVTYSRLLSNRYTDSLFRDE